MGAAREPGSGSGDWELGTPGAGRGGRQGRGAGSLETGGAIGGRGMGRTDDSYRRLEEILKGHLVLPPASKQRCPSHPKPGHTREGVGSAAFSAPTCTDSGSSSWGFISKPLPTISVSLFGEEEGRL